MGGAPAHRHPGEDGQFLLLHSAAYGHYLAATDVPAPPGHRGLRVEKRDYYHPEVEPLVWQAILSESEEEVYLRNVDGACLRANGRFGNSDATVDYVDDLDSISITRRCSGSWSPSPPGRSCLAFHARLG